jgi:hypothetical protein
MSTPERDPVGLETAVEVVASALWATATEQEIKRTGTDFNVAHMRYEDAEDWRKVFVREQARAAIAAYLSVQEQPDERVRGVLLAFAEWLDHGVDLTDDERLKGASAGELLSVTRSATIWRSGLAILGVARAALAVRDTEQQEQKP